MAVSTSVAVITALLNTFKENINGILKESKQEFDHVFNNGLELYINNYYEKFLTTKTFIYRDEKIDFYETFFPVTLSLHDKKISSENLNTIFKKSQYIALIGKAGSGKSMLMKHIFLSSINSKFKLPILIELRNLNTYDGSITDYIFNILTKKRLANSDKIIERILNEGNFIFLFDGYDEIYSETKNKITVDLEEFMDSYNNNYFCITSRPGANAESLERTDNYYINGLSKSEVFSFVKQQFKNHENSEYIAKIFEVIKRPENKDYKDYLSNPLLLSMFIFTFNSYPELPKTKSKFYWNVFDTLCTKHDAFSKKGFWLHERKSKLQNDDFEQILKWFSYVSILDGHYNFDHEYLKKNLKLICGKLKLASDIEDLIYDLTVSISIIIQDGLDYTFPHKSLQEYFTASFIKELNEEQKEKIYKEKFLMLEDHTNGGNTNLYNLCFELDKNSFSKNFLIPSANEVLCKIERSNDEAFIKSYFKILKIEIFIHYDENNKLSVGSYRQGPWEFAHFCNCLGFVPSFEDLNADSLENLNTVIIPEDGDESKPLSQQLFMLDIDSQWGSEIKKYVKESNILSVAKDLIKNTENELKKLENEIKNERIETDDLLFM